MFLGISVIFGLYLLLAIVTGNQAIGFLDIYDDKLPNFLLKSQTLKKIFVILVGIFWPITSFILLFVMLVYEFCYGLKKLIEFLKK